MPDRRGFRFALEVLYLAALAAALAFTTLNSVLIVAVMLGGWALVTATQWAGAASRPHFASGLPPRWHVPFVALPPAQPLELVGPGYPQPEVDEAATWIASAALREELLGEWPIALEPEDTEEVAPATEDWVVERMARYHVDPFAEDEHGRFGRRREVPSIEVPAKPPRPRRESK